MRTASPIISGSLWTSAGALGNQIISFLLLIVLARQLTPADFGLVSFIFILVDYGRSVVLAGLPETLVRRKTWSSDLASTAFWFNNSFAVFAFLIACAAAFYVDLNHNMKSVALAAAPVFLIDSLGATHEARLKFDFGFRQLALIRWIAAAFGAVAAIATLVVGGGLWALVFQRLVSATVFTGVIWIVVPWHPRVRLNLMRLRRTMGLSSSLMISTLVGQLNTRVVDLVTGAVAGVTTVGLYQMASRGLNVFLDLTINPVQKVSLTAFAKMRTTNDMGQGYIRLTSAVAAVTLPVFSGAALLSSELMVMLFGTQWISAAPAMALLALSGWPATLTRFLPSALAVLGRPKLLLGFTISNTALGATLALIMAPFGVTWVAGGVLLRMFIAASISLWMLHRSLGLSPSRVLAGLIHPALCSTLMAGSLAFLRFYFLSHLAPAACILIMVPLGALLYCTFLFLFARPLVSEILKACSALAPSSWEGRILRAS